MNNKVGEASFNGTLDIWYQNLIKKDNIVLFNGFFTVNQALAHDTIIGDIPEEFKPGKRQFIHCAHWNGVHKGVNFVISDSGGLDIKAQGNWELTEVYFFNATWTV